jgi:hypothetical protein
VPIYISNNVIDENFYYIFQGRLMVIHNVIDPRLSKIYEIMIILVERIAGLSFCQPQSDIFDNRNLDV